MAAYPYSIKLLWSPIVDSFYSASFGRRKSWLVPLQLTSAAVMAAFAPFVEAHIAAANVPAVSGLFFILVLLAATQVCCHLFLVYILLHVSQSTCILRAITAAVRSLSIPHVSAVTFSCVQVQPPPLLVHVLRNYSTCSCYALELWWLSVITPSHAARAAWVQPGCIPTHATPMKLGG